MYKGIYNLFILLLAMVLLSCGPERRLAQKYLKENKPGAILLIAPDFLYKNSYKIPYIKNFETLPQEKKDSIAYFTSDVLQYTQDSIYIKNFMQSLTRGLKYFGFSVYFNQPADEFLNKGYESYILNFVQIQLEEYFDSISDESSYDSESQNYMSLFVTAMNLNNWIEVTKLNHEQYKPKLLYSSQTITDDFNGNFVYYPLTGKFDYDYVIDSLNVDKLYTASSELGYKHAQWIFDYILNDYIKRNMPPGVAYDQRFTYDFKNKMLKRLKWQPFQEM
ncbi:MAG: hypothetical protein ACM3ME_06930 [Chloroflexota bacterium]|nr:hypothetical protein [Lentimicrobium sp.]